VPEEAKSILELNVRKLRKGTIEEKKDAAAAIGALGGKAKSARRALCLAMLDQSTSVRTAAADALKNIDPLVHEIAVAIFINRDINAVQRAGNMDEEGEPLIPLFIQLGNEYTLAVGGSKVDIRSRGLAEILKATARVGREDPTANDLVIVSLTLTNTQVRATAVDLVPGLKYRAKALQSLLNIARSDESAIRISAITALVTIADTNNTATIRKTLRAMRYDGDPGVRASVDRAISRLEKD
jgi:HEAT repeat protein